MAKDKNGKELGEGISQAANGKYQARFRIKNGKRSTRTFDTLREAKAWLLDAKHEYVHTNAVPDNKITVDEWFDFWINDIISPKLRYNTLESYKGLYKNRISPFIGVMKLKDVRPYHCQDVIYQSEAKGFVRGSVLKERSIMKQMFFSAVENKILVDNPITASVTCSKNGVKQESVEQLGDEDEDDMIVFTRDEQQRFMKDGQGYKHFPEFVFVLNTGLRCGEMQGLKWDDIDWKNRVIWIRRTMFYNKYEHEFYVNPTKTRAGRRKINLKDDAFRILSQMKDRSMQRPRVSGYEDYVFLGSDGRPLRINAYEDCLERICNKMGTEKLTMHSLRHTFATRCIEEGMKPKTLQRILGHSRLSTTMDLYVHVTDDEKASELKKVQFPRLDDVV